MSMSVPRLVNTRSMHTRVRYVETKPNRACVRCVTNHIRERQAEWPLSRRANADVDAVRLGQQRTTPCRMQMAYAPATTPSLTRRPFGTIAAAAAL